MIVNSTSYLNKILDVKIDRQMGSRHPKYEFVYPINYGYIPNTKSYDGEELDCYVLGIYEPLKEYKGRCIAVIHRINDKDDKLIIVPDGRNFSDEEIKVLRKNNYKITFEMEENWYRQGDKLLGNKEFLVQDPDGYLLRFSEDLGEKNI